MHGTQRVIRQGRPPRPSSHCPVLPVSPSPNLRGSRGAMRLSPTRAFPGSASRAVSPPGGAPQPNLNRPSIGVAYPLLAHSRLGFSPNLGLDTAYHTTSCGFRRKTKRCPEKKSEKEIKWASRFPSGGGGWPGLRLHLSRSPAGTGRTPSWGAATPHGPGTPYPCGSYSRSIPKKEQKNA